MSLTKRFRAAFDAFRGKPQVVIKVTTPDDYDKYQAERAIAKEEAICLLEPHSRFVAIKAINTRSMPRFEEVEVLAHGLRLLAPGPRVDAMQALCEAVPTLILNSEFKALAADKALSAQLLARS